jgi:poly(ADP-ribose) glycohydrolase ARH3
MASIDSISLATKFRGCLVGSLLGDCLGAPYELNSRVSKTVLQKYFDKLEEPYFTCMYVLIFMFRIFIKVALREFVT